MAGLILAGGRGERLGGAIKSELVVGDRRLLDRVADRLARCSPLLVGHGRIDPALLHLPTGTIAVPDLDGDYAGPLAGLAGAIAWSLALPSPPDLIVSVAVDTPFLPADYVERLAAGMRTGDAAVAAYAGQPYPTNAIWRLSRFRDLPAQVHAGTAPHSLKRLAAMAGALTVEWREAAGGDPFANINTPAELSAMQARGASGEASYE